MKRCAKCILPEEYPDIQYDEESVCNFCHDYQSFHKHLGKEKLLEEINNTRNHSKYDCVVPVSGGKDSTFILYYVVKELGLNPLAVNYNSGWQNDIAAKNIVNACKLLNVDYISRESKYTQRMIYEILLMGLKQKAKPQFHKICWNCETILRSISIFYAQKYNIRNIIWGSSALESGTNEQYINYKSAYKNNSNKGFVEKYINQSWSNIKKFVEQKNRLKKTILYINYSLFRWRVPIRYLPRVMKYQLLCIAQRLEMNVPFRYAIRPNRIVPFTGNYPRFIHFFDYIEWDSMNHAKFLKEKIDWKHPEGKEDRFDCLYHAIPNYYSLKEKKITGDGINYCNYIRENKLTREEALERENLMRTNIVKEYNHIIEKLGLSKYKATSILQTVIIILIYA